MTFSVACEARRSGSTGGEVANALVCKTSIHGFKSHPVLQKINTLRGTRLSISDSL
jgi:hypothetical protein